MSHKTMVATLAALLTVLVMTSKVDAWGGYHVGYTPVRANGAYPVGGTPAYGGPYGYDRYHYNGYGVGGRDGVFGAYGYGGLPYGFDARGGFGAGVYRGF